MQLLNIISSLDAEELNEMEARVALGKNNQQLLLFKALKELHVLRKPFAKEEVYQQVFGKPYSEDMDYRWRNEVRNLKNKLFDFLVAREHYIITKEDPSEYNKWILLALTRRHMNHLFTLEWAKRVKQVEEDYRPDIAQTLFKQKFDQLTAQTFDDPAVIQEAQQILNQRQAAAIRQLLYIIREIECGKASMVIRQSTNLNDPRNSLDKELELEHTNQIDLVPYEDYWSRYIAQVGLSYLVRGEPRINVMKTALKLLRNTHKSTHDELRDEVLLLNNIGIGLTAAKQYQQAEAYYLESEQVAHRYRLPLPDSFQYMLVYNYLLAGNYQSIVDYFTQHEANIVNTTYQNRTITIYCYALLFLGNGKTAVRKAIKHLSGDEKVVVQIRLITIISYLLEQHWQDAKRELHNYRNSSHFSKTERAQFINSCFEKYITAQTSTQEKAAKLMGELKQWLAESDPRLAVTSLFLLWLKRTVLGN